jgi:hypothetical protein
MRKRYGKWRRNNADLQQLVPLEQNRLVLVQKEVTHVGEFRTLEKDDGNEEWLYHHPKSPLEEEKGTLIILMSCGTIP